LGESVVTDEQWADAQPVREHVLQLEAGGMSLHSVALAAGVLARLSGMRPAVPLTNRG